MTGYLAREEISYSELKNGSKGIALGEEDWFLEVSHKDAWKLRLVDLAADELLTAWATIHDLEDLRSAWRTKAIRERLKQRWENYSNIVENILIELQEQESEWVKEENGEQESLVENVAVNPEVRQRALELLKDPLLLCRISKVLHEDLGLVGETKNALLTYHTMISSKLEDPVNQRCSSRASIGKSTLVIRVAQLFPPEDLIIRGGLTKKALYYMPEVEVVDENTKRLKLTGKVLIVLEESESQDFLNEIKPLLSHDVPVLKYSFVEEKVTRKVLLEGWPAYIGITTVPIKGEEHETRTLLVSPDRGKEKYGAVITDDAERHAFPWNFAKPELEPFRQLIRELKPVKVWIPWLPIIAKHFPRDRAGNMRDWKKFRTYIEAVAFLHQYQRPHITINDTEYILASPLDLEIAIKFVQGAMAETVLGLERDVKDFYEHLKEENKPEGFSGFTYKELMTIYENHFGEAISRTTLRNRYVEKLEDLGLVEIDDSKKPYNISVLSESLTPLANFEKAVVEVRSDEAKAKIMRKTLANLKGVQTFILEDAINKIYCYTPSNFSNLFELLERSKSEEYFEKSFFFESAKDANDLGSFQQANGKGEAEPTMVSVKSWCRAYRNEHSEISLPDLAKFIKEELKQEPQRVIREAFEQSILAEHPRKMGFAVVV